jgi:predicted nucleotidyltransferase
MKITELALSRENIQYHSELNPACWDGWRMLPRVRERLIDIAQIFVDYLDMPEFDIEDVRLTGSMANFNWTRFSDFDLHIVTDYKSLQCDDVAEALYAAKKTIWNNKHDITIRGHDVELYIEDSARPPHSSGMYSILEDRWIDQPEYVDPKYDHAAVDRKVKGMIDMLQKILHSADSVEDYKRAVSKVYSMRQAGLESGGEFSTENLAFKVLRNLGWIDRLRNAQDQFIDQKYSL